MDAFKQIETAIKQVLQVIGDDPSRDALRATPRRVAESLLFLTRGYREDIEDELRQGIFPAESRDLVLLKDMEFYSLCEHHILPFYGHVSVAYIPGKKLIGISKIARIVDHFAARLQVQERMTAQIADMVFEILEPEAVGVLVHARHLCLSSRGERKNDAWMVTQAFRSNNMDAKREVMGILGRSAG